MTTPPTTDPFASLPDVTADPFAALPDATSSPAALAPKPLERTPANYGREVVRGVGRGLLDDVGGLASLLRPIETAKALVKQTDVAWQAEQKTADDLKAAYPDSGGWKNKLTRLAAGELAGLENAPLVGGMVQHAEQGGARPGSPEALGAAAEGVTALGAPELVGKGVGAAARSEYVTKTLTRQMVSHLIKPEAADVKFGKNPAMAMLDERIVGNSLPSLGARAYARLNEIGQQLDHAAIKASGKVVDVSPSLKPVDYAMQKAAKDGNLDLHAKLVAVKEQLSSDYRQVRSPSGNVTLRRWGPKKMVMTPQDALAFKRMVADQIRWNGADPFNDDLNAVRGQVYGSVKDSLNQAVPELKGLNERYSNLVGAAKAIERRIPAEARNARWSLSDIVLGTTGHVPLAIARKLADEPGVTTRVAGALDRVGKKGLPRPAKSAGAVVKGGTYAGMTTQRQRDLQEVSDAHRGVSEQ